MRGQFGGGFERGRKVKEAGRKKGKSLSCVREGSWRQQIGYWEEEEEEEIRGRTGGVGKTNTEGIEEKGKRGLAEAFRTHTRRRRREKGWGRAQYFWGRGGGDSVSQPSSPLSILFPQSAFPYSSENKFPAGIRQLWGSLPELIELHCLGQILCRRAIEHRSRKAEG